MLAGHGARPSYPFFWSILVKVSNPSSKIRSIPSNQFATVLLVDRVIVHQLGNPTPQQDTTGSAQKRKSPHRVKHRNLAQRFLDEHDAWMVSI
jgi:hypothetical protein